VNDRHTLSTTERTEDTEEQTDRPSPPCSPCPPRWRVSCFVLVVAAACTIACGKKGPPLPPLLKLPTPPPDFTAERRGDEIKLQFTIPTANTDGTRPANIDRIDVYGFTGPSTANDEQVMKFGTKVASVSVKAPKNPDVTTEPEEPPEEPELKDEGIDQGAIAQLEEPLTQAAFIPVELPKDKTRKPAVDEINVERPLAGPPRDVPSRIFMAVGVNTRGRKGPSSKRTVVPLVPAPSAPSAPAITYNENAITVKWQPSASWAPVQPTPKDGEEVLPSRFFGIDLPTIGYKVYDVSPTLPDAPAAGASQPALAGEVLLTRSAIAATAYEDKRMDWGKTRCYAVRALETIAGQTLESDAPPPACVTLTDTFPPAAPRNLQHIAAEGVISLIWEPNSEPDLAGYLVLRGVAPGDKLEPITPAPIPSTVFEDKVGAGTTYVYAVQAVDRAGNVSPASARVEDAAR
jgi:hypothetical protein